MSDIPAAHRDREVHVALDHLNTHKPKQDRWLALPANVHSNFISVRIRPGSTWSRSGSASPRRHALRSLSCTAIRGLREAIDRFLKAYQETAGSVSSGPRPWYTLRTSSNVTLIYTSTRYLGVKRKKIIVVAYAAKPNSGKTPCMPTRRSRSNSQRSLDSGLGTWDEFPLIAASKGLMNLSRRTNNPAKAFRPVEVGS
jgi:hypothetical protein